MVKNNAPCECGHSNINHVNEQFYVHEPYTVNVRKACGVRGCGCNEFKMDNLRYLEKEDESRQQ